MNANKLKGIIAEAGLSQRRLAAEIGVTDKTFYDKMKHETKGNRGFYQGEIEAIIKTLSLTANQVMEVFFPGAIQ